MPNLTNQVVTPLSHPTASLSSMLNHLIQQHLFVKPDYSLMLVTQHPETLTPENKYYTRLKENVGKKAIYMSVRANAEATNNVIK